MAFILLSLLLLLLPFHNGFLPFGHCQPRQFPKSNTIFASSRVSDPSMNIVDQTQQNDVINALLGFKRTISDPNGVLAGWNSSTNNNPCNWRGVSCSHGPTSRVEKLNLSATNLTGALVGELGQLRNLKVLDLSQNKLHGNILLELLTSL
jgi:hypothetical protein